MLSTQTIFITNFSRVNIYIYKYVRGETEYAGLCIREAVKMCAQ